MNEELDPTGQQRDAIYSAFIEGHAAPHWEWCPYDPSSSLAGAWHMGRNISNELAKSKREQNADLRDQLDTARATQTQLQDTVTAQEAKLTTVIDERDQLLSAVDAVFVPEALMTIKARRDNERWLVDKAAELETKVTAQEAEIKRLRAVLENIAGNAPQEELTGLTMRALGQARGFYYAGVLAKKALGNE